MIIAQCHQRTSETASDLTVLSAFSGLGGLDLGFESAGYRTLACIEYDADARRTLERNRPHWHLVSPADILESALTLWPESLGLSAGELTVLAGGPPCQPFSKAAQWTQRGIRGLADPRSDALEAFLLLVERFLPRAVVIENVTGFVTGRQSALDYIKRALQDINVAYGTQYAADVRVLNAADFGVPQRRMRAFVVATRDGERVRWPKATHDVAPIRAWDAIGELPGNVAVHGRAGRWRSLLPSIPEGHNYLWHTRVGGGLPLFGYRTRYWSFLLKLAKDAPSWTLAAQPGPSAGPFHWDNRPLTVQEMLRLQSFPADWKVEGSQRSQTRQVGNATPPLLAEVVARSVSVSLGLRAAQGEPKLLIRRLDRVPGPAPVEPVPSEYRKLVGLHSDHPGAGKGPAFARSRYGVK